MADPGADRRHRDRSLIAALLGTPQFRDLMLEIGVLAATVLVLGVTVFVLRIARREGERPGPA
jgi:hypothetical protein